MGNDVDLTVYPADCDAFGHLNQAASLVMFERARWELLARGPGMDAFTRSGTWPAVRRTTIEYVAPAFPGDVLRFRLQLIHHGRTSFTLRQAAHRTRDDALIASAEFVFVCVDRQGRPTPVPGGLTEWLGEPPPAPGQPRRHTVNGVSIAVDTAGEGPALLLIHGYPLNRALWRQVAGRLDGCQVIAPDLRGFGGSDAPDLGYSIEIYAADLLALLDALGVGQAVVCGLSMGGYVAFEIARRARTRLRGLVLMATRAEADAPEARKAREAAMSLARDKGARAIAENMLPRVLSPGTLETRPDVVDEARRMMAAAPVPGIVGALGALRDRPDSTSLLPTLAGLPVLVLAGADDALTSPEVMRGMAGQMPGATFQVVPGAGHLLPLEQPDAVVRHLQAFLAALG